MPTTMTPNDSLLTPKDGTEAMDTDSKFMSASYTVVSDSTDPVGILPAIDCRNLWNFTIVLKNNSANALDKLWIIPMDEIDDPVTSPPDFYFNTNQASHAGTINLASGATAFVYSKINPLPKYLRFVAQANDVSTEAQFIGSYL